VTVYKLLSFTIQAPSTGANALMLLEGKGYIKKCGVGEITGGYGITIKLHL